MAPTVCSLFATFPCWAHILATQWLAGKWWNEVDQSSRGYYYRAEKRSLYVVWWSLFLLLLFFAKAHVFFIQKRHHGILSTVQALSFLTLCERFVAAYGQLSQFRRGSLRGFDCLWMPEMDSQWSRSRIVPKLAQTTQVVVYIKGTKWVCIAVPRIPG